MPTYNFQIVREGNLVVPCSVPWRVEAVGADPITPGLFAGSVFPSGTALFESGATVSPQSFVLNAGTRPARRLNGRIVLRAPVGCKIDPLNGVRDFSVKPSEVVPVAPFAMVAENMAVHSPEAAQDSRITWLAPEGFEVAGDDNDDDHSFAVWFKNAFPDHFEISYDHTKNEDTAGDAGGRFWQFWFEMIGTRSSVPANVAEWIAAQYQRTGYDPVSDSVYGDFGVGRRVSYDTDGGGGDNEARLVQWDEGTQRRPTPNPDPPSAPMSGTNTYHVKMRRQGSVITATVGAASISWTDEGNRARGGGRGGWRGGRGRGAKIERHGADPFMTVLDDPDGPETPGTFPRGGAEKWKKAIPVPAVGESAYIRAANLEELRAATSGAGIPAGKQVVQTADINLNGADIVINFNGAAGARSYWRSDRDGADKELYRRIMNGRVFIRGNYGIPRGLAFENCMVKFETLDHIQFESNWGYGLVGSSSEDGWLFVDNPQQRIVHLMVGFNIMTPRTVGGRTQVMLFNCKQGARGSVGGPNNVVQPPNNLSLNWLFTHNHTDKFAPGSGGYLMTKGMLFGRNPNDGAYNLQCTIQNWLDTDSSGTNDDLVELKFSGVHCRDITVVMGTTNDRRLKIRHGRVTRGKTASVTAGEGNLIERCLWILRPGDNTETGVTVRDGYHKVLNCGAFHIDGEGQPTPSTPHANGVVEVSASNDGDGSRPTLYWGDWPSDSNLNSGPEYRWVSAGKTMIGGCHMKAVIRDSFGNKSNTVRPDSCRVAPADPSRADRNWQIGPWDDDNANPTDFTTPVPGANYNNVAPRQLPTNVGPRAYARLFVGDEVLA